MLDNSKDKGYLSIRLKETESGYELCEYKIFKGENESNFYVDYEDGTIYIDWGDGSPRNVIGYYEQDTVIPSFYNVWDATKTKIIGKVGKETIYFRKNDVDYSAGRYMPDENCLAWYTQNGNITTTRNLLEYMGTINGGEFGGAAAFVAIFYAYKFFGVFYDYFVMDYSQFKVKYADYIN